ncbi:MULTISPECIES: cytochrome c oxidase assembly protein [unclassified Curtobacterium]|uniref:cytochrome c oxidase assembly protein n=1 Tax=unclassified Curtobacterium TaxID=257496 RepID=UPI0011B78934|nr:MULTISPECIES: cytochrome c oxidase assembly protein [unclassified Curtobacterium]
MHSHGGMLGTFTLIALTLAGAVYVVGAAGQRRRGQPAWPIPRTVAWIAGLVAVAAVLVGPLGHAGNHDLTTHVLGHVVIGMVAPVLLVLGSPVTLARRTLEPVPLQRLGRLAGNPLTKALAFPVVAAVLAVGASWLLYTGPTAAESTRDPGLHSVVMIGFLLVGLLLTAAVVGVSAGIRRSPRWLRVAVLALSTAVLGAEAVLMAVDGVPGIAADQVPSAAAALAGGAVLYALVLGAVLATERRRDERAAREEQDVLTARRTRPAGPVPSTDQVRSGQQV